MLKQTMFDMAVENRTAMMEKNSFLRNIWYYALPGGQLKPGTTVAKTLLGEPVLLGRSSSGKVFAMRDICPHRAVPLTCGRFDGQEVECCYHGWRFDTTGRCTTIPSLVEEQNLDLSRFRVKHYPVREVQGNVWIYMAASDKADNREPDLEIPLVPHFGNQSYQLLETVKFPCFVDHAVVGLMDPAHGPFVHRVWWWRSRGALFEKAKAFGPTPYGFAMQRHKLLKKSFGYWLLGGQPEVEIVFCLPSVRIESITTGFHTVCNLTTVTPISETETEVNSTFYWTVPWLTVLKPFLRPFVRAFLHQDRDLVVKQQVGLQYNPPLMLINDADTQARWYYQLKAEFARATAEDRPFTNPVKEQVLRWRS